MKKVMMTIARQPVLKLSLCGLMTSFVVACGSGQMTNGAGGGGQNKPTPSSADMSPLSNEAKLSDSLSNLHLVILEDLDNRQREASLYVQYGRVLTYSQASDHDIGMRSISGGYCIFQHRGLVKGQSAKVLSIRSGRFATPALNIYGVIVELENGATLKIPGSLQELANQRLEFCLGGYAEFRTSK